MLKIWGRTSSVNVQKVLWCADELGLDYERIEAGGAFGVTREKHYLAMNPNAVIPTIDDDGFVLWESNTIVRYLAAKHSAGNLCPSDPRARADGERWMDWQLSAANAGMVTIFWGLIRIKPEERDSGAIEAARQSMCEIWSRLDRTLAERDYVGGDTFTMADIPIGALVYRWFNLAIERNDLPHLKAWYDRLSKRPAYKKHVMVVLS